LTGTDPDRWIEERLRGMTLDLGFAHLRYPDGVEAGVIDVPGHERFLHNMLAGAAGMDVLLLVIAANEGPKPQTREHLAILEYLNVRKTIVVLSKSDTVDAEELAFAHELVREEVAGTIAANAPIACVSSVTGSGLEGLRTLIYDALVALPPRSPEAPAYLPVDRVFALPGHGTIITGTLMQGRIRVGDQLPLSPYGRDVRIRSLQVFGQKRTSVDGGSRVAVNLPGIETSDVARGAVLASAQFATRNAVEVHFRALAAALPLLKRRTPVRAHLGAAEILGTLVFETVPADTSAVAATLHLRASTVVFPGAAFVVRRLSPKTLLGGGRVAALEAALGTQLGDSPEAAAVALALHGAGLSGADAARVGALANVRSETAEALLAELAENGRALRLQRPQGYVAASVATDVLALVLQRLSANETEAPWIVGTTGLALSRALAIPEAALGRLLAVAAEDGRVAHRGGYYASPAFVPQLTSEQQAFFDRLFAIDPAEPSRPLASSEVMAAIRAAKLSGLAQALETLLTSGALVRVQDAIYRSRQIAEIRANLEAALRRDKQITMAAFRDLVGTSRKFAVPLLEWFDATGVTIRSGDVRLLRVVPKARTTVSVPH